MLLGSYREFCSYFLITAIYREGKCTVHEADEENTL